VVRVLSMCGSQLKIRVSAVRFCPWPLAFRRSRFSAPHSASYRQICGCSIVLAGGRTRGCIIEQPRGCIIEQPRFRGRATRAAKRGKRATGRRAPRFLCSLHSRILGSCATNVVRHSPAESGSESGDRSPGHDAARLQERPYARLMSPAPSPCNGLRRAIYVMQGRISARAIPCAPSATPRLPE
jgi:hypothetical protein